MFKKIVSLLPSYMIFIQGIIAFIVPYALSKLFKWLHTIEKE